MSSDNQPGNSEENGQVLPQRVAELAGELTEAQEESRRKRIARQITQLASRGSEATMRGVASRTGAAWRGTQSGRAAAVRRAQATGGAARKGVQAGRTAAAQRLGAGIQWLTAQTIDMAPRVPIRSIATLREQHPGLDTEELADLLIAGAGRASAGIGAAVGAAAAVPFVPSLPLELGVETLALVAVELKLIAELHEAYGQQVPGTTAQRMLAYLTAWSQRRGVRLTANGISLAVGSPVRRQLERRLLAKAGQSAFSLAPLLTGVAAGAVIDHHETRRLGHAVRADLRKRTSAEPG